MAITYPLSLPTSIGIASVEFRTMNAVSTSQSPFTYKQQVIEHPGERWEATVSIPPVLKEYSADWKAFLVSLRGRLGTFLLYDPDYQSPRGTATSATITGVAGDRTATITMTGTLLAGDMIQIGTGSGAKLHTVLQDRSGSGIIDIWPSLRATVSAASVTLTNPSGVFRLSDNTSSWSINDNSIYSLSFNCVEDLT